MHRSDIIEILDGTHPRVGRSVALLIHALIVASAVIIALETMPELSPELRRTLRWAEGAILALFTVEYITMLVCALRLLRLVRLLKLFKASRALDRIARAFEQTRAELLIFSFIATVVMFLAAVGIHHFERAAQPEYFGSIPASLWWAIATLSTVGYGDVYPITTAGRVFTGFVLLVGIGIVAVPAGLITAALVEQTHEEARRDSDVPPQSTPEKPNTEDDPT